MQRKRRNRVLLVLASGSVVLMSIVIWTAPRIICQGGGDVRRVKVHADLFAVEAALELYRLDHGAVPTTEETLGTLVKSVQGNGGRYLEYLPVDPWGHPYQYASDGRQYSVLSFGPDGARGGTAENSDIDLDTAWAERP